MGYGERQKARSVHPANEDLFAEIPEAGGPFLLPLLLLI